MVTEYISEGEPVGSRRLSRRYGLNLSAASIRNVLADLEDRGFLSQPHASAGRVPTDVGFRVFVEALVQMREVSGEDRQAIASRMSQLKGSQKILAETGQLLSSMAGAAAVVVAPAASQEKLTQLRFVPLNENELLAVVVTRSGAIQNRVVQLNRPLEPGELERLHNYLVEKVGDHTLAEVRDTIAIEVRSERGQARKLAQSAGDILTATIKENEPSEPRLFVAGKPLLFDRPEFSSADKIRRFLSALEDKETMLEVLERTLSSGGVQVLIGSEANLVDVRDVSVITANYKHGQTATGALGIIGTARMDYGKVVPLVQYTAEAMGRALSKSDDKS